MQTTLTAAQPKATAGSIVWPTVAIFVIALAVRLAAGAVLPLLRDEAWHLLAGHSWIHEGTLRVDQGAYTRTGYFTVLVAWFMQAFGETLAVARLPGVIGGAALVAAVFVWLRRKSGIVAAWTGGLLLCFHDLSILVSAEVRFYSLHALCLWLVAAIVYQVTESDRSQRQPLWMLVVAAALAVAALHLQVTAGVALVAIGAWAVCDLAYRSRSRLRQLVRSHWILAALSAAIVLGGALAILLHPPASLARIYADFRSTTYWAEQGQDWALYYQRYYAETISPLLGLFPLAFIAAFLHRPRAAVFCAFLFVVPTLIMSFGGMKADRYVFFALPYLLATWGLAAEAVFPSVVQVGRETWARVWNLSVGPVREQRLRRYSLAAVAILALGFVFINQTSYRESAKLVAKSAITVLQRPALLWTGPDLQPWASHRSELMGMIKQASVFVATMPSTTIYELGPFDVFLSRTFLDDVIIPSSGSGGDSPDQPEWAIDRRIGRPTISTVESLQAIMNCYPTGIVIVPSEFWRNRGVVTEEVANFLMVSAHLTRFAGPASPKDDLLVFEWRSQANASAPACEEVKAKLAPKA